jgi:DNA polymerase V
MLTNTWNYTWVDTLYQPIYSTQYKLPLYWSTVAAGFPQPGDDCIEKRLDLNELVVERPHATFFARVSGDSMRGAGIHHQDVIVVDRSLEASEGRVIVAVVDGEMLIKRLHRKGDRLFLLAENPEYPPLEITEGMDFSIWGVVTSVVHRL